MHSDLMDTGTRDPIQDERGRTRPSDAGLQPHAHADRTRDGGHVRT